MSWSPRPRPTLIAFAASGDVRPVFISAEVVQQHPDGDPIMSGRDLRAFERLDVAEDLDGAVVKESLARLEQLQNRDGGSDI